MSLFSSVVGLLSVIGTFLSNDSTDQIISTIYGPVQGRLRYGAKSGKYYSFQGIPYARPPLGDLRFKDPLFPLPWTKAFDARKEGPCCHGSGMFIIDPNIGASEDCLHLNVFSKNLGPKNKSPVMVFIHGGGFIVGSSSEIIYGPDLLLQKNVVVVTLNYRLGVFGFLSNSDPKFNTPGNAGLKDQSFAIRWVRSNILNFGGDPDNITVFGESAGGASVHFHMISDFSKNLFNRAICESGSALMPWTIIPNGDFNERLARKLGWYAKDGPDNLMKTLMSASANDLATYQDVCTAAEIQSGRFFGFLPTIEPYDNGSCFLPTDVSSMSKSAWSNNIPLLIGSNSAEGHLFFFLFSVKANTYKDPNVFQYILPPQLNLSLNSPERIALANTVRQFYFGNGTITQDTSDKGAMLLGDKLFWQGQASAVRARVNTAGSAPTYLYRFDYASKWFTLFKGLLVGKIVPGSIHAEELLYLWSIAGINAHLPSYTTEGQVMNYMVEVWTQFATNGSPVTAKTPGWLPVAQGDAPMKCINFNVKNRFIDLPETNRIAFWDSLYPYI